MKPDNQELWDSGIVESVVIQTIIDGLKILGKDSITIAELKKLRTLHSMEKIKK